MGFLHCSELLDYWPRLQEKIRIFLSHALPPRKHSICVQAPLLCSCSPFRCFYLKGSLSDTVIKYDFIDQKPVVVCSPSRFQERVGHAHLKPLPHSGLCQAAAWHCLHGTLHRKWGETTLR